FCRFFIFIFISLHWVRLWLEHVRIISVEPGHDVTLPCEVPDGGTVAVVEWRRTDLKDRYVLLYRNKVDPRYQLQSYRDRVDLQIKNRNISLILKNVIPDDEGTYECRVFQRNSPRQQRSVPGSVIGGDPRLLVFLFSFIIPVKPGHDVTLPCEVPDGGTVAVVEWIRTDLKDGYVLLYRNKQLDPDYQHQSYRDRVDLQIKNRNISLILKNVSADDEGTYECRVFQRNSPRQQRSVIGGDPVCSISLRVVSLCDEYLMPQVDDLLDRFLTKGYWQILSSTFSIPYSFYQLVTLPFVLFRTTFQHLMDLVLHPQKGRL
uniref:Ig-like domain-containing protein n=1 Tax=Gouania willdenowi TaxID=441366 RepID=A0A8C5DE16_GOUWI